MIAVLEGIRVFDNAALPGKIAQLVVGSPRRDSTDPATLDRPRRTERRPLFYLFVGATMPVPRNDVACDNSLIPPWAYTSSFDPNLLVYVPLGSNTAITILADRSDCLNPPPIPPAAPTDAHFLVSPQGAPAGQPGDASPHHLPGWSAGQAPTGTGSSSATGAPASRRCDCSTSTGTATPSSRGSTTTPPATTSWEPSFDDDTTTIDPDTCQADGTCWKSDQIHVHRQ